MPRHSLLPAHALCALLIGFVAVWSSSASALSAAEPPAAAVKPASAGQNFEWREIRDYRAPTGAEKGEVSQIMRTGDLPPDREAMFDNFWNWHLSLLTWDDKREKLHDVRKNLKIQLYGKEGAPHDRVVRKLALPMMRTIIADEKCSPLVVL